MITLKLPYKTENKDKIKELQRQQSCIVRYAYNRFFEGKTEKEIRKLCKSLKHVEGIDSWFVQCGIKKAQALYIKDKERSVKTIFGGSFNFRQYSQGKITNEEWKSKRLLPLCSQGEKAQNGNRKLTFLKDKIILKINRKEHVELILPKLRKNYKDYMEKLEELTNSKQITISFELTQDFIYLILDETFLNNNQLKKVKSNRIAAIDLNPNYIGFSITDYDKNKIIYKEVIDLKYFTQKLHVSTDNKKQKKQVNKQKYELIEISKYLVRKAKHYNCIYFALEDLNIRSKDNKKGKAFNRLCNNKWNRNIVVEKVKKYCRLSEIEVREVFPGYSSTIGNILHNYPDMIASSLEIGRRGYYKYVKDQFYPKLISKENLSNRWKDAINWNYSTWKELHGILKTLKLKYRRSLEDFSFKVCRLFSQKSYINLYSFR